MRQKPSHRSGKPTKAAEDLSSSITSAITADTSSHSESYTVNLHIKDQLILTNFVDTSARSSDLVTRSTEATSPPPSKIMVSHTLINICANISSDQVSVPSNHGWSEDNGWQTQAGYDFTTTAYPLTPGMEPTDMSPGGSDWSSLAQMNNKRILNQDSAPCHVDVEQKDNGWHIPTNLANEL